MQTSIQLWLAIAAIFLGLLGLGVVMWLTSRAWDDRARWLFNPNVDLKHYTADDRTRPWWGVGILAALFVIALTSWVSQRDAAQLAADRRAAFDAQIARLGCAPQHAGDTPLVVLVIDSAADPHTDGPRVQGCARVADRSWMWWHLARGEAPIYSRATQ